MPKILITGGQGQIAQALCQHTRAKEVQLTACSRSNLDITSPPSIEQAISQFSPDFIINTAAYTAVDKAENERERALQVNHLGTQHLAAACRHHQIPLIHLSTDYVFDGTARSAYHEDDLTNPVNHYGYSKWLGEQAIREICDQYIILRVSGVFSEYATNFFKTILNLATDRNELRVVADQITCPTYAGHIADVIYSLIAQPPQWGTYHYCDAPAVSWHEFASTIIQEARHYRTLQIQTIHAIPSTEYPTAAKRPAYSVLSCTKIEKNYGIKQAEWKHPIKQIIKALS